MTSTTYALRRAGAAALTVVLAGALAIAHTATATAQDSPEFTDLDQTVHAEAIRLVAEDGITQGYPDGTFRPREDVRRDQMATFVAAALRLDPRHADFPDVPRENVHQTSIGAIAHAGITQGFPDGTYRPREFVTRGQMATFLAKGLDLPAGDATFSDVPPDYVHADAIAALADSGITEGFPDGTFRPNAQVKRDQMAAFLARGIPLPRELPCPGSDGASASTSSDSSGEATTNDNGSTTTQADGGTDLGADRESEDLVELESGDVLGLTDRSVTASSPSADPESLGPAVPGTSFPLTSVIRTSNTTLEAHSQDLGTSRGTRVDQAGDVRATTTIPAGRRTWATAQVGTNVYAGQWGVTAGSPNLYRYSTTADGDRRATAVATVPSGNEFWTLTRDSSNRLWAGTRSHADGAFRDEIGLRSGRTDGRHVVHRIDPSSNHRVTNVTFCVPDPPTNANGLRPDVKQLAFAGSTLYVGTGQQSGGARLYAFEPGDRDDIPAGEVRDLTPAAARSATGVFALTVSDRWIAFGTQASTGQAARLIVIDRASERTRVNVPLSDSSGFSETRVDAVAIRDDRVVATGFSGKVYNLTASTSGSVRTSAPSGSEVIDPPVARQFHRFVEIQTNGNLRGVTQQGVVWTRAANGDIDRVNLVDTGAPVSPGLPHSLHVGSEDIAVGASSAVTLRSTASPEDDPRTMSISGEAKAMTSDALGNTFIASYPNATLWRVDAGGDEANELRSWTAAFRRPADAEYDQRPNRNRVNVIAREDNNPMSEPRTSPRANFGFRPSRLFPIDPTLPGTASGIRLGYGGDHSSPVSQDVAADDPIEASTIRNGVTPAGSEVFIGDTRGGVQRLNAHNGVREWYRAAASGDEDRPVVDIELVGDRLVVVHSGQLAYRNEPLNRSPRTVIRELDPSTGEQLARYVVSTTWAIPEAVTSGSVTMMPSRTVNRYFDRETETYTETTHARNDSFGGPYAELDRTRCALYSFVGTPSDLVRTPYDLGDCAVTDPPIDLPVGDEE